MAARAAQCAGSDCDGGGVAVWRAAGWGDCYGDHFQLAGAGAADGECDFKSRLRAGARVPAVDWVDVRAGEPADGRGEPVGESADAVRREVAEQ